MTSNNAVFLRSIVFIFSILAVLFLNACSQKYYPPNTKHLTYDRFIDISYIENIHELEFLQYLEADTTSQELYKRLKPRTAQNIEGDTSLTYLYSYDYRFVPALLNIDFANEYCKWRSEIVTYYKNFGKKNMPKSFKILTDKNKSAVTVIKYSIPTKLSLHIANETQIQLKKYNKSVLKFKTLNQESIDSTQLYLLRCTAVVLINGKITPQH